MPFREGKTLLLLLAITITIVLVSLVIFTSPQSQISHFQPFPNKTPTTIARRVKYSQDYTFVLVGDSMTATLGNSDELRMYLTKYYPNKSFEFLNYGFGSTNILSVEKRLQENTTVDRVYQPILNIDFDLILIESFGHNPLSQYPLVEGLKKQTEALDRIVALIKNSNPRAAIVFVATIAPNSQNYAKGQVDLTPEQRKSWAEERTAYIKNHINYAQTHNIPLVNVYEKSLLNGDGNLIYIDKKSYIHPSPAGVYLISQEIADYLYQHKILDQIKKN